MMLLTSVFLWQSKIGEYIIEVQKQAQVLIYLQNKKQQFNGYP